MFWKRKKQQQIQYDKSGKIPVIRSSICTGEQTAGFKDESSGQFEAVMLIQSDADLEEFFRLYAVNESDVRREW